MAKHVAYKEKFDAESEEDSGPVGHRDSPSTNHLGNLVTSCPLTATKSELLRRLVVKCLLCFIGSWKIIQPP